MKQIFCGQSGTSDVPRLTWDTSLREPWPQVLELLCPTRSLRPIQSLALQKRILETNHNLIVSAPTNSGKSLVGWLVLLEAVRQGKRAILLEPLKAIARQMADDLEQIAPTLSQIFEKPLSVKISTGDYRIEDELPFDPPPGGEIVVATPERLDALLRNSANLPWFETIGAVVVDEAHLISSPQRGLTLECLMTSLLCLKTPPRIALLSATLGNVENAQSWLEPCTVLQVSERFPPLDKWILALDEDEDGNEVAIAHLTKILQSPETQVIVFVYRTQSAQSLSQQINEQICPSPNAVAYHAQMSQNQRERSRQAFELGESRVVVATTALAMGINFPATHVLVRDLMFPGVGRLAVSELLQMMGRAGRGDRPGAATVLLRPTDRWESEDLALALREEEHPALESALDRHRTSEREMPAIASQVAPLLGRRSEGMMGTELKDFLGRSLGGQRLVGQVEVVLRWLESQWLAYREPDGERYLLTVLGQKATRAVLPLPIAASYAQLLRDLMSVDPDNVLLNEWRSLDHLLVLNLLAERPPSLRRYSAKLAQQVEAWCEAHPTHTPLLFRKWIWGQPGHSRVVEVLGSLGVQTPQGKNAEEWAHRAGYLAMFRAIVLWERSHGLAVEEVERRFGVQGLEGIEERWRDELLWLLAGVAKLLEVRTFYYHLKENCDADGERIKRIKGCLRQMECQVYGLQEQLKFCSPLGSVLSEIRRFAPQRIPKLGVRSVRKLEEAGVGSLWELVKLNVDELVSLGIQRRLAEQVQGYVRRRMQ